MTSSLYEAVKGCLTRHFNLASGEIHPGSTLEDLGLDSLALVELSCVLQDELGLTPLTETETGTEPQAMTLSQFVTALEGMQPPGTMSQGQPSRSATQAPS
ncbi:acyl carrier protein [Streptomyces sp. NPDC005863]|uniref:acyl carrier protein n=1 Tax=unclassified Streptomyces TaxID=2593676 RepID=UPI0033EFA0D1